MGTFFGVGPKHAISEEARTFLVAFPGLNISKVPGTRALLLLPRQKGANLMMIGRSNRKVRQ